MAEATESLGQVRERIDALDDRIQDLIMERTILVQSVVRAKAGDSTPAYRPGREAGILRRLLARHDGPFPKLPLIHVWREIIAASVGLQGNFAVALHAGEDTDDYTNVARDHFGAATPLTLHQTDAGVVNAVTEGSASVGILPFPNDGQMRPWWPRLVHANGPSIVARLPFGPLPGRSAETDDVAVIAMMDPEPSGADRSFVALRTASASSRARITDGFKKLALEPTMMLSQDDGADPDTALFLVELDDFIEPDDPKLHTILDGLQGPAPGIWLMGAYAKPFTRTELDNRSNPRGPSRS